MSDLTKTDLMLIKQVYLSNAEFGMPFLPSPRWFKRAKALAERGLLRLVDKLPPGLGDDAASYNSTEAGIDAYNTQLKDGATP